MWNNNRDQSKGMQNYQNKMQILLFLGDAGESTIANRSACQHGGYEGMHAMDILLLCVKGNSVDVASEAEHVIDCRTRDDGWLMSHGYNRNNFTRHSMFGYRITAHCLPDTTLENTKWNFIRCTRKCQPTHIERTFPYQPISDSSWLGPAGGVTYANLSSCRMKKKIKHIS